MRAADEEGFTLLELAVVCLLMGLVIAVVANFLISANETVARSTSDLSANSEAQNVFDLLDSNLRFSSGLSIGGGIVTGSESNGTQVIGGGTALYVSNSSSPACTEWSLNGTNLTELTAGQDTAETVATGISAISFSANQAYQGLVGVQLTIVPGGSSTPPVSVDETVSAENLTQTTLAGGEEAPSVTTTPVCTA